MPRGADGGTWKRWQNEIGMLLHEHPVNVEREANGNVPVNGVWFWGGGRLADVSRVPARRERSRQDASVGEANTRWYASMRLPACLAHTLADALLP